jgi:Flp pilus assembly protein CpaB
LNRRILTGVIIAVVGIGLIIIGVITISGIVRQSLAPLPAPTLPPAITEKVVVATHDMPVGAVLNQEDITLTDMPIEIVPRNSLGSLESAIGRFTTVPLVAGEMVLSHHLADPTNISHDIAYVISDDVVLMAVPAVDLMSQLNILQRGDVVDIFASIEQKVAVEQVAPGAAAAQGEEEEQETRLFTFDALQRVNVSAIIIEILTQGRAATTTTVGQTEDGQPRPTPTPVPSSIQVQAYLLALKPQDALVLKNIIDAGGKLDFVLRSPTSDLLFDLDPVLAEYLVDRYDLQIER